MLLFKVIFFSQHIKIIFITLDLFQKFNTTFFTFYEIASGNINPQNTWMQHFITFIFVCVKKLSVYHTKKKEHTKIISITETVLHIFHEFTCSCV